MPIENSAPACRRHVRKAYRVIRDSVFTEQTNRTMRRSRSSIAIGMGYIVCAIGIRLAYKSDKKIRFYTK